MVVNHRPQNKDHLKSDRDATMGRNPAITQDQYGSRHNKDEVKLSQRRVGWPREKQDLPFRESSQDVRTGSRGERNRMPGRRFKWRRAKAARNK
ncbi:MAG: hypothetical protein FWD61_11915 [Phycisphaerales bacterium]|nr:hypothetical protein [Phycisphaerales bacterium]